MTGLSILFNMNTDEACYVYDHIKTHRQTNEERYSSLLSPLSPPGRRTTGSLSDYRGSGSLDRPRYTPVYGDLSTRFRPHYDRLPDYPRADSYFSQSRVTSPSHSTDGSSGSSSMSRYTRSYDRSYDSTAKNYDSPRYSDRDRSDTDHRSTLSQPFEFSVDYSRTSRLGDTKTHDRSPARDDVTVRRSPARITSLSERALARPKDNDAPSDRPPSGSGRPRRSSGDSCSSQSSERSGHAEDRALFHALKNRYQESAERSTNDPGVRTPFSTWRRSGDFDDVTSSKAHDDGKERIQPILENSDAYDTVKHDARSDEASTVRGQSENMSVSTKEQTDQNPEDLIYNFRKALHRHRISEHEKGDSNRLSDAASDSGRVTAEDESVTEKLDRLKAAKARIEERKRSENVKSGSFATEYKVDSNRIDNEKVETQDMKSEQSTSTKSTRLSRQKLVSDDLKAKYMESRKDEKERTPEKGDIGKTDSLSKKRSSRRSKHKEHMDYWSKDQEPADDSKPRSEETSNVPTAEEMLLGSTKHSEKSSSLRRKQEVSETPLQFCADYTTKSTTDSVTSSVSPSLARKHDKNNKTVTESEKLVKEEESKAILNDQVTEKTKPSSDSVEARKAEKSKRYKKYVKAKSHELGALSSEPKEEPPKVETKDDSAIDGGGLDEMSRLERITKYKEERRKQLASISSRFSSGGSGNIKELPSLFLTSSPAQDGADSPLLRSKSMKVESETRSETPTSALPRSKSLKQGKHSQAEEEDDTSPQVMTSKISGLQLAEIGSAPQTKDASDSETQYNTDNIMDKLQALRKLREEHLKKTGMTVEELKSKRSSREDHEMDKSSRGSSVESYGVSRTLLADRVFESKDRADRTPSRERVRSSSREKTSESRHSFKARESIPESESDRTTDMSDADSDIHVRVKPRKFFHDKHAKDSENANKSMFEFSTVYSTKKDDSVRDKKEITKDIKPIPEVVDEKSSESGRESVDSTSRVRRKLPSIEDVLGSKGDKDSTDHTRDVFSPDRRSVISDSSESHFELTKENITQLSAYEIEKRKIAGNIQKAKSRFKSDDPNFDPSKFEIGSSYSSKPPDTVKHKTSSLDRNMKLHDYEDKEKTDNLMPVKEDDVKISTMGLDLAQPVSKQSESQSKPREKKYGGGGFELGMAYTPKKPEKPAIELVKTEEFKPEETVTIEQAPPPKQKKEPRKYGGGGLDLGTAFSPKPAEPKVEINKSKEPERTSVVDEVFHDKPAEIPEQIKKSEFRMAFSPKLTEKPAEEVQPEEQAPPKLKKEPKRYGGGGLDLGTAFVPKPVEPKFEAEPKVEVKAEPKLEVKAREVDKINVSDLVYQEPSQPPEQIKIVEQPKKVRAERKYGGEGFSLGTSFVPKKREVTPVKEDVKVTEASIEVKEEKPKQVREERKYGGGGLDLGTSFAGKKPEKPSQQTGRAPNEITSVQPEVIPDTKVSTFTLKTMVSDEQPVSPEVQETSAKPPSSPRTDRRKLAEQRYGKVALSSAQPFEFSQVYAKKDSDVVKTDETSKVETVDVKHVEHDITDSVGLDKTSGHQIKTKPDNVPKQVMRPVSFTHADVSDKPKVRKSSLDRKGSIERQHSDISDTAKPKFEKVDLKAQAMSTATGKVVEHPLSPRRQSPVRFDQFKSSFTGDVKINEVPSVIETKTRPAEIDKRQKDIRLQEPVKKPEIKKPTQIRVEPKVVEPVKAVPEPVSKEGREDHSPDKSMAKFVDLHNVELKSPVKTGDEIKTEPEVPLFLEQKATKVSPTETKMEEKTHERGRKADRTRGNKPKAEKTVIAQVRNETILQDSTLDDILNRNVDYLSDMEPPDFTARGRGGEKKGRPQSIHEPHKTKRAFKKRAAMRRTKSEDRSHHKVADEESRQPLTVNEELRRSFKKVKESDDRLTVHAVVKQQDRSPNRQEDHTTSTSTKSQTQEHATKGKSPTSPVKTSAPQSGASGSSSKLTISTSGVPQSAPKQITTGTQQQSTPKQSVTGTQEQSSIAQVRLASGVQSCSKLQTSVSAESKNFPTKHAPDDAGDKQRSSATAISTMLYGESRDEIVPEYSSSQMLEQPGGMMSDSSEISERRKVYATGDSARESETSRVTTDSDHSVSSMLSEGSRRRRKDKSSMRKSKLNEGQDVPTGSRKRDSDDSSKSSRAGVRRTASSRLARENKGDKQKENEEVLDVFKRHDLEVSKSWTDLNQSANKPDKVAERLLDQTNNKHLSDADRAVSRSLLDSHSVLPSRFAIPNKVSAAISKLTEASERSSRESSPVLKKNNDLNSPRGIKRGSNFSQLLQKFSASDASSSEKSDTDTQSPRGRKNLLRRQEAYAVSSHSSDDTRRTPERTQSLRLKTSSISAKEDSKESSVQRSASFKSDFMKRRFSPEPEGRRRLPDTPSTTEQSDKPSAELASVLSKRSQIVAKQQEEGEDVERKRIHDGKVARADRFSSAANDEVIVDSEVLQMLQSRRKETDSSVDYSSVSEAEQKSHHVTHHVTAGSLVEPAKSSTQSAIQPAKSMTQDRPVIQTQSSYESKTTILLSPTSPKDNQVPFVSVQAKPETSVPKLDLSSIDTSLNVLKTIADDKSDSHGKITKAVTDVNVKSPNEVVQFIKSVEGDVKQSDIKPVVVSKIESKSEQQQHQSESSDSDYKIVKPSFEREFRQQQTSTASSSSTGTIDITNKSEIMRKISTRERTPETQTPRKTGPMKVMSPLQAQSPSSGLKRTESVGRTDSERPKGILKRTPSLKHTGVSVDPELAEVLMSRRTRHDETEEEGGDMKLSPAEEIRREREAQGEKHVDKENDRSISVAERIFQMTNKIEEAKSCPITPRARSGFTTPKSILLGSGSITPKSQYSFDEGNSKQPAISGSQLIEKLTTLEDQQSQGVSHKRQKFQQRKRTDARTRTQPITLQEIQLADGLETVKKFRHEILNKASNSTFDVIKQEQLETEKGEFPLHFRKEKRPRGDRHKTLPVTAAELSAIPEGQVSETMNTLKKRFESQGARDSKADSGILSGGSDGENLDPDSWRSLSVEENITEDDPIKMSVSAKASMFSQIQETIKEKKSASGAKRYIDRKKRERSRTLPITEDEVKLAAEFADEDGGTNGTKEGAENGTEVVIQPTEEVEEESDELSRQSLRDKVKLFTSIEEEKKAAAKKKGVPPPPKRRKGRLASRFTTQPVTIEEVEKAAKISPLACSLIKPPDPDILSGLSIKDQRELIVQHAQQTLSQPNSRAGSRASSRATSISDLTEDPQTALNTNVNENNSAVELETTVRPSAFKGKTFTASKSFDESHASHTVEKFTSDLDTKRKSVLKSELEQKLSLQFNKDSKGLLKPNANVVPTISDINRVLGKEPSFEKTSTSSSSEVKSILKKEGSFETRKMESDITLQKSESFKREITSSEVVETDETEQSDDLLGSSGDNLDDSDEGLLDGNAGSERYIDTPVRRRENKARRRFNRDRKETERYKTQPAEGTPDTSEASHQKKKYVGRHLTQPVTPDEKMEAEIATEMPEVTKSGSIQDRLSALKKSGDEEWRKRVSRPLDLDRRSASPEVMTPPSVKLREKKQLDTPRPHSIADRLNLLDSAQANWRDRVGETDVKKFTVEHKIAASGQSIGESPLVARLKGKTPRREHSRDSESSDTSDLASPSTPTKEGSKFLLPREVICTDIPVELMKEDTNVATLTTIKSVEEENREPSNIEVPNISSEIESFFHTKQSLPTKTPELDVTVDDFNELFLNASGSMLETAKKVKPKRRHAAKSRNPLKTMSASIEVRSEYTEVITGVAEKELKRVKTSQISQNSGFAVEALAGLASKENFSKVELRKTDSFGAGSPGGVYRLEPYLPLMLIHIKGRRKVQCRLVAPNSESINSGDCYALITTDKIIQWHGEFCNVIEKAKAADFCEFVKQKRDLGCKKAHDVMIVDEKQRSPGTRHFWDLLGGQKPYMAGGSTEEDELYENHITETNMIYKLEQTKLVAVDDCWGAQPKYEMLNPYSVFVFDFGTEVYVWQGKSVSPAQRKISIKLAQQVWDRGYDYTQCDINPVSPLRGGEDGGLPEKCEKRPDWALFGKVNQNMETILFREKFADWPDTSRLIKVKSQEEINPTKVDLADLKAFDAKLMVPLDTSPVSMVLEGSNVGRGNVWAQDMDGFIQDQIIETLKIRIWHVLEYEHYEIEDHSYGQFHEGDTYVIRWQYMITNAGMKNLKGLASRHSTRGRERCAYFFWQGKTSTVNEKGASALMTVELDEERGPQVRVSEGKEMPCFLNLFKGRMIIHIGKREEEETNTQGPWKMYCLRNEFENEMCLIEVNQEVNNLRSVSSCLLLNVQTGQVIVWHGCKSPSHTQKLARKAADNLKERCSLEVGLSKGARIDISEVHEGVEMLSFWRAMDVRAGDRSEYHSLLNNPESFSHTLRLFHMTSVSGVFEVNEILNPSRTPDLPTKFPVLQDDLYKASQPALFLIDNGHEVFLWQGWWPEGDEDQENVHTGSAQTRFMVDRRCAMETTIQYCKEINPSSPPPAYMVYAGLEPLKFTNLFPFWNVEEDAKDINIRDGRVEGDLVLVEDLLKKLSKTRYTFAELTDTTPPEGVDPLKLETYLSDQEFEEVLHMTREAWDAIPNWKKTKYKQEAGLF